jgi:prepilin-type processing-associated H-X9-DG protein
MAIGALVCGIVGMLACPLVGIVGLVLGIVALTRTNREPNRYTGKGLAIGGIVTGGLAILLVPVMIAILLPSLARARELAKRTVCSANMVGIGSALHIYAQDDGMFPEAGADWQARLTSAGNATPMQFTCPSSTGLPGKSSYVYVPGYGTGSDPSQIILYEPIENHNGEGGNILYVDGHVSFVKSPAYEKAIGAVKPGSGVGKTRDKKLKGRKTRSPDDEEEQETEKTKQKEED